MNCIGWKLQQAFRGIRGADACSIKSLMDVTQHVAQLAFAVHSSTMNTYAGNGLAAKGRPTMTSR
jgi:hypothetical protein